MPNSDNFKFPGYIAEATIWDTNLSDPEVAIIGAGYSPLLVRPANIVFYIPFVRNSFEDLVGGLTLTETGTVVVKDHPPVYYPGRQTVLSTAAAAAASLFGPPIQVY